MTYYHTNTTIVRCSLHGHYRRHMTNHDIVWCTCTPHIHYTLLCSVSPIPFTSSLRFVPTCMNCVPRSSRSFFWAFSWPNILGICLRMWPICKQHQMEGQVRCLLTNTSCSDAFWLSNPPHTPHPHTPHPHTPKSYTGITLLVTSLLTYHTKCEYHRVCMHFYGKRCELCVWMMMITLSSSYWNTVKRISYPHLNNLFDSMNGTIHVTLLWSAHMSHTQLHTFTHQQHVYLGCTYPLNKLIDLAVTRSLQGSHRVITCELSKQSCISTWTP